MKKTSVFLMVMVLCAAIFAGCAGGSSSSAPAASSAAESAAPASSESAAAPAASEAGTAALKVVCLLNGNLGDKSFFDSANKGMEQIKNEMGCETKVVEMGFDNTKWEPALLEASEQDWDIIIVGTWQMQELVQTIAPQFPDKHYVLFDSAVDYSKGDVNNVYSITYKQNDGAYLAGIVAAGFTSSGAGTTNEQKVISAVCGMDIPVINDFLVGYIQGATDTDPDVKVMSAYVGDFNDTAKAKEMAISQFNMNSDVGFNVAAQAGLGLIDAAKEKKVYAIGVDADQSATFAGVDPDKEAAIITSVLKNIDVSLVRTIKKHLDGSLKYGSSEVLGITEDAVGIAKNDVYMKTVPADVQKKVEDAEAKIKSGEIKVKSAFDMTTEETTAYKNAVAPK